MKDINNFSRRKFITSMAKAGAMLPFAGQMLGQSAFAAGGFTNVLFLFHPNGVVPSTWNPTSSGSIVGVTNELSFGLGSLKDYHSKMIVLKNIYIDIENPNGGGDGGGHKDPMKGCMTGDRYASTESASIDYLIAEKLGSQGVLSLGVRTGNSSIMKASKPHNVDNDNRPTPNSNPFDVATKLKARLAPTPVDPLQGKVYDAAIAETEALLTSGSGLSVARKSKLEQHRDALKAMKNKAQEGTGSADFNFYKETLADGQSISGTQDQKIALYSQFPDLCKAQIDNVVGAFKTGLNRVATLQLATGDENGGFANYCFDECWDMVQLAKTRGVGSSTHERWYNEHSSHTASHNPGWYQTSAQVRWHMSMVGYAIKQLEANGILDQTLIVTISDEGDGATHDLSKGSIVLAGGTGGGRLSMGRIIDCNGVAGSGTHKLFGDIAKLMNVTVGGPWKSGIIT